jgi:hypothetical protein
MKQRRTSPFPALAIPLMISLAGCNQGATQPAETRLHDEWREAKLKGIVNAKCAAPRDAALAAACARQREAQEWDAETERYRLERNVR